MYPTSINVVFLCSFLFVFLFIPNDTKKESIFVFFILCVCI